LPDVIIPVYDLALTALELAESSPLRPEVTIFNNGNVPVSNIKLVIKEVNLLLRRPLRREFFES
jgi:hypothetical protein